MKNKINIRLVGIAILAIIATVISITIVYYGLFQSRVRNDLAISAKLLKDTHYFEHVDINVDEIDLSTDLNELRVTWIDKDGTVLYDNDVTTGTLSNHLDRPEIKDAFDNGEGQTIRKSDTLNKNTFYYAVLLDNGTVLRVATEAESLLSVFMSAAPIIALIVLIIIALCIAISQMLTRQLISPIEKMAKNLDNSDFESPYIELAPFAQTIREQHTEILSAAKARQDFTANVSHELKTPLTAISGYAELLEGDMVAEDKKNHFYHEIHRNSDRLLALINDIIRLSEFDRKTGDEAFEEFDLFELVQGSMEVLSVNARQRGVEITLEGESHKLIGNKEMIKELIENLAQNAIRYNNEGGKVLIKVDEINNKAALIVKDNGIGIPAAEQQRVFERFYRVDKSRSKATGGTGLGLAIVKHIVEIHDARIELDSAPGVGTTVSVYF